MNFSRIIKDLARSATGVAKFCGIVGSWAAKKSKIVKNLAFVSCELYIYK